MAEEVKLKPGWLARDVLKAAARVKEWETESARRDCPWKCYPDDPACLCEKQNKD